MNLRDSISIKSLNRKKMPPISHEVSLLICSDDQVSIGLKRVQWRAKKLQIVCERRLFVFIGFVDVSVVFGIGGVMFVPNK